MTKPRGRKLVRALRLSDGKRGWYVAATTPRFGYLPDGVFTPVDGASAGRAEPAYECELEFEEKT